ncbi:MAG TPA: thiamine pyrophosphate-binding protein [Acidimicrobiales bacterium]|nr:thiamine pyrophosphate-binding protein [Acidimicrobiales bacterium]
MTQGPSPDATVAGTVLRALGAAGAHTVFGLPGTHNLAFWRVPSGPSVPRLVSVRHEQTAVYAADGWARASGRLGGAVVTTGPGAANTTAAFGEAATSGSPLVLVASEVPQSVVEAGMRGTLHQSRDQAGLFAPLAKATFTPRSAAAVANDLASAITTALTPPQGPVYLDIPADILRGPAATDVRPTQRPVRSVDEAALEEAADLVNSAGTVAIWAGGGVIESGAEELLSSLASHLQAPVVTTFGSRGALGSTDPGNVVFPPHEPEVEDLLAGADLLLAFGTNFDAMMTKNATLRLPGTIIDVNVDLGRAEFGYRGVFPVHGDAGAAIEGLLQSTKKRDEGLAATVPELKERVWARLKSDPRTQPATTFVSSVEGAARGNAIVMNDMTIPGYWLGNYYCPSGSRAVQYPVGWGTLGYALPASIGAAFAGELSVLAVCGDGGFMFAVGELATIAQEQLPVTVLLVDDGGYGMLRYGHRETGGPSPGTELLNPDFLQLAGAFGIVATRVDDVGAPLGSALRAAISSREPRMVVCQASLFPPRTTSPRWHEET